MCTVTFVPTKEGVYLTSNRDEKHTRSAAKHPVQKLINGYEILYPIDTDTGGTWIAVKNNGDAAVLLNGGFTNHIPASSYRQSRGIIFLELISAAHPSLLFQSIDLVDIAPFTLVLFVNATLTECRWDGEEKHVLIPDQTIPHIWSSATLYDKNVRAEREDWFREWFANTSLIDRNAIIHFHTSGGNGNSENAILVNRDNQLFTVSITSVFITRDIVDMKYIDTRKNIECFSSLQLVRNQAKPAQHLTDKIRKFFITLMHWEYWPFHFVYGPVYLYWFWLSIKARSFFFFSAANPSIENAGFTLERKSRIYDLIPQQYYPKTLLCKPGETPFQLEIGMKNAALNFPLIAKPDIGERGTKVKLIRDLDELLRYSDDSKVNFLLQEFISYENEIGVFYYRIPGEEKGKISGIVGKEFLTVTGDGISTIEMLVRREKRFFLQLAALKKDLGDQLQMVLSKGELKELVPYGNHCRGAKFIDLSSKITEQLTESIDAVCKQIPEFYFGRMDIRFKSWEELEKGKHFSIIELNGAGSEPTHMYDHSIFFAWKEITRHWKILYKISRINKQRKGLNLMQTKDGLKMLRDHAEYMKLVG